MTPIFQLNWLILQFINIIFDLLCLLSGLSQTWYVFTSHVFFFFNLYVLFLLLSNTVHNRTGSELTPNPC